MLLFDSLHKQVLGNFIIYWPLLRDYPEELKGGQYFFYFSEGLVQSLWEIKNFRVQIWIKMPISCESNSNYPWPPLLGNLKNSAKICSFYSECVIKWETIWKVSYYIWVLSQLTGLILISKLFKDNLQNLVYFLRPYTLKLLNSPNSDYTKIAVKDSTV